MLEGNADLASIFAECDVKLDIGLEAIYESGLKPKRPALGGKPALFDAAAVRKALILGCCMPLKGVPPALDTIRTYTPVTVTPRKGTR